MNRRLVCAFAALALPCFALAESTLSMALPQLVGTYPDTTRLYHIQFQIDLPRRVESTYFQLELTGTSVGGWRDNCETTPGPAGAEIDFSITSLSVAIFSAHGWGYLPGSAESWTYSLALDWESFFSPLLIGGLMQVELQLGVVFGELICYEWFSLPTTTIVAARLVSDGSVDSHADTWGRMKALFAE